MMDGRLLLTGVLAALVLVAGAGLATGEGEPQLSDPDDDGRVRTTDALVGFSCTSACDDAVGAQAPPALELTSVTFLETPRDLQVRLEVVGFEEDLRDAAKPAEPTDLRESGIGDHESSYVVCWSTDDEPCREGVYLQAWRVRGELFTRSATIFWGPNCDGYLPCQYGIPFEIETGAPGAIEWHIPRELLPNASAGDSLQDPQAYVFRTEDKSDSLRVEAATGTNIYVFEPSGIEWGYIVDHAEDGRAFTFETRRDPGLPEALRSDRVLDPPSDFDGAARQDLDVLEVRFGAEEQNLTVSIQKALVGETPRDQTLFVNFGYTTEVPFVQVVAWADDGEWTFAAQRWLDYYSGNRTQIDVQGTVVPGEPGWVNLSVPLSEAPVLGLRTAWMWAGAMAQTPREELRATEDLQSLLGTRVTSFQWDVVGPGTAYEVTHADPNGTVPVDDDADRLDPSSVEIGDTAGDAQLPPDVNLVAQAPDQNGAGSYEISRVAAEAESAALLRLTLEVQNLSRVRVPPGYDAVLYAAAVETAEGRFVAVARYEPSATDPGETDDEWFCTTDTSVLTDDPQAPPPGIPITGFLRPSQDDQRSGTQGASPGAMIRFEMPRECLGDAPAGPLGIRALGGASFLIRDAPGGQTTLTPVDHAHDSVNRTIEPEPLTLASTAAPPTGGALSQPFGVENFWDLLGIAGTVLASGIGAVLVRRRRGALKKYLAGIEQALDEHPDDPSGREAALRALGDQAKADLVRGRLSENQYVVVKDRLGEELAEARGKSVEEAFGELPHRLLTKLKRMVSDGTLSPEDRRLFSTMLEDSELTEAAKDRVRRKLAVWADPDDVA